MNVIGPQGSGGGKTGRGMNMKNLAMSALFGVSSLLLVNMTEVYTGVSLAVSRLSLLVSGVLGIPGVLSMLVLNQLL